MSPFFLIVLVCVVLLLWSKIRKALATRQPSFIVMDTARIMDDIAEQHPTFYARGHNTFTMAVPIEIPHRDLKEYRAAFKQHLVSLEPANTSLQAEGYQLQLRRAGNIVPVKMYKNAN